MGESPEMSLSDRFKAPSLVISWSHIPWGSDVAGFPVLAITNLKVNLYARLGFRFPPFLMTFHWVREAWA